MKAKSFYLSGDVNNSLTAEGKLYELQKSFNELAGVHNELLNAHNDLMKRVESLEGGKNE